MQGRKISSHGSTDLKYVKCRDETFCDTDVIVVSPDLYFSRRNSEVLIVEPESASWCILAQPEWIVFRRMGNTPMANNTNDPRWTQNANYFGRTIENITFKDQLTASEFFQLLYRLSRRNIISINGAIYYQPQSMWNVQSYPHYYNLHVTEVCNLACKYCRIFSPRKEQMMTPETCRIIVRRALEEIPSQTALIGFHGGEPLLNMKTIEAGAVEAKKVAARLGKPVRLSMQTNGTLLSSKTVAILKELGIEVGVSIDGPQYIHDQQRVLQSGEGSHYYVQRGLQAAADGGLQTGYLAVVHNPKNYMSVLDFLVKGLGAHSARINYTSPEGKAKNALDFPLERAEEFARECLKIVDYIEAYHEETGVWLDIDDVNIFIFHLLFKHRPHMCYRSPCGIGNSILGFGYDGQIYLCDEVVGNPLFRIGSIHEATPLNELLDNSPIKKSMMDVRKVENLSKCSRCTWKRFHGAGCTSKTYAAFGLIEKDDLMCYYYQIVFEELMWRLWKKPELAHLSGHYGKTLNINEAIQTLHM